MNSRLSKNCRHIRTSLTVAGLLLTPLTVPAAVISWGPATAVSTAPGNSSDVSTNGTFLEAFNAQASDATLANPTVNGVTFTGTSALLTGGFGQSGADLSADTNGGDAAYDALLTDADNGGGGNLLTINIGGDLLSVGTDYEVQVWFIDDRPTFDGRVMLFGDGNGNSVLLNDEFSIGTFTADGASQTLSMDAQGFGNAHITAYQLRTIPEPSSALLLGVGILTLATRRRR